MSTAIRKLKPEAVWSAFADLNAIPRPSKKEERVMDFMRAFGKKHGLETVTDNFGNVIIKKPGTKNKEDNTTVILQGHVDMVHQKNNDTEFDFEQQGIEMYVDGDWVRAKGTTLGADNGLGVASIMAVLASTDIPHPPLEALFTVDEEAGMGGAINLQKGLLEGKTLLNLDTEEDHVLTIGCAGGLDTLIEWDYMLGKPRGKNIESYTLTVKGLQGGHSGMDINAGRGNAIKLLARILHESSNWSGLCIAAIEGGSVRNAIPREAFAHITVSKSTAFKNKLTEITETLKAEFKSTEPNLVVELETAEIPFYVMASSPQKKLLAALNAVHNGVFRMSPDIKDLVETSSNLAVIRLREGKMNIGTLQRSSIESGKHEVARTVSAAFELIGADIHHANGYPGWKPNPDSDLLRLMQKKYKKLFKEQPTVEACHAGLECGLIEEAYPGLDMISFGPNIFGAHSPDERASISSFQKFWKYFTSTLADL